MSMKASLLVSAICLALQTSAFAEVSSVKTLDEPGKVIASGSVPDEASRATILARLRELYGAQNVVDRLEIGGVVPPPNWSENMAKILTPNLKQVHKGQLQVSGTQIAIKGQVANEALRQQVVSNMATSLNPTYSIDNGLVAAGGEAQSLKRITPIVAGRRLANLVGEAEASVIGTDDHRKRLPDGSGLDLLRTLRPRLSTFCASNHGYDTHQNVFSRQSDVLPVRHGYFPFRRSSTFPATDRSVNPS